MRILPGPASELARHDLTATIRAAFGPGIRITAQVPLGAGAFGVVHAVTLSAPPGRAVAKVHTYPGEGAQEAQRLRVLRAYLQPRGVRVPRVYAVVPASRASPGDAVVMEHLAGVSIRQLGDPERLSGGARGAVQATVVDLLLALHAVRRPAGYGDLTGPAWPTWGAYYGRRVAAVHRFLRTDAAARGLHPTVRRVADAAAEQAPGILATFVGPPTLVHGDVAPANLLVDPRTYRLTGLLDPLDSCWGDPALDTLMLTNSRGHHYRFLEAYAARTGSDAAAPLRYWFYMVWEWLSYFARFGLDAPAWFLAAAERLAAALRDHPRR